jgi:mono/diheme cytochrome c family protein
LGKDLASQSQSPQAGTNANGGVSAPVDFAKDVQPILTLNCIACHQGNSATRGLQLDSYENVMNGSDSGKVVVPGDPNQSLLIQRITDMTGKQMPPQTLMSKEDIAVIVAWVQQGAKASVPGVGASSNSSAAPPAATKVTAASSPREIVNQYCVSCHNQKLKTGNLVLDSIDFTKVAENAAILEKVVHKVGAGMMPPAGAAHPDPNVRHALVTKLENDLDHAAVVNFVPPGIHRLNRTEYENAVRDLLDVEVDPAKFLPPDDSTRGFDNMAGTLTLSPALLEG